MTVAELIEELKKAPQDVLVRVYGTTRFDEDVDVFYQMEDGDDGCISQCSECGAVPIGFASYCWNCGAKLVEE